MTAVSVSVYSGEISEKKADAIIFPLLDDLKLYKELRHIDNLLDNKITRKIKKGEIKGKPFQTLIVDTENKIKAERIVLIVLGKKAEITYESYRRLAASSANFLIGLNKTHISIFIPKFPKSSLSEEQCARASLEGALLASYAFEEFKSKKEFKPLSKVELIGSFNMDKLQMSANYVEGTKYVRDISNTPSNEATPAFIAKKAKEIPGVKVRVIEKDEMEKLGMGGILAVSRGSREPPKLIIIEYRTRGAKKTLGLVGKGVTFDSGGISLKPSKDMYKMKFDKAGACTVLGIVKTVSKLKLPINLVCVLPCTENLPGGSATKPGDIIRPYKGETVEVINTDAEGRLILADALSFISEFKPDYVIDLATLTGACVVALGSYTAGLMGNSKSLIKKIKRAGELSGEPVWELPLFKDYEVYLKSDSADIKNVGGGKAGTITAALFLQHFVKKYAWAHLDIAGTAFDRESDEIPYLTKGASGFGVLLMCYLIEDFLRG